MTIHELHASLEEQDAATPAIETGINLGGGREIPIDIVKLDDRTIAYKAYYLTDLGPYAGWHVGGIVDLYDWAANLREHILNQ